MQPGCMVRYNARAMKTTGIVFGGPLGPIQRPDRVGVLGDAAETNPELVCVLWDDRDYIEVIHPCWIEEAI